MIEKPDASSPEGKYEALFSNEAIKRDLKGRAVRSTAVTYLAQGINFATTTASTVVLARLLVPDDFGLIALASAAAGVVAMFNELGLSSAMVQRTHVTHQQVSNLFWINLGASFALATLGILASPLVAQAFGDPRLTPILMTLCALFPLRGFSAQHVGILNRRMEFKSIALRGVASNTISVAVAITFASLGYGYWSLAFGVVANRLISTVLLWYASPWRPGKPANIRSVKGMVSFGAYLSASSFFGTLSQRADAFIIGGLLGTTHLGLFSKANGLLHLPLRNLNNPLGGTAVPALAAIKNDPARYRSFYRNAISSVTLLSTPVVVFSFFYAEEIVLIVLGESWIQAAEIYKYLCPAALAATTNVASGWVYKSWGHVRRQAKATFATGLLTAITVTIGCQWGVIGAAIAISIQKVCTKIPYLMWCYKGTPLTIIDFFSATWRAIAFSLIAIAPAYLLTQKALTLNIFASTSLAFLVFIAFYSLLINWLHGPYERPISLMKSLFQRRNRPSTSGGGETQKSHTHPVDTARS